MDESREEQLVALEVGKVGPSSCERKQGAGDRLGPGFGQQRDRIRVRGIRHRPRNRCDHHLRAGRHDRVDPGADGDGRWNAPADPMARLKTDDRRLEELGDLNGGEVHPPPDEGDEIRLQLGFVACTERARDTLAGQIASLC
jgi:hypothetical protein